MRSSTGGWRGTSPGRRRPGRTSPSTGRRCASGPRRGSPPMTESTHTRFSLLARIVEISNSNIQVENRLKRICDFLAREIHFDCVCIYRRETRGENLTPWVSSCVEIEECALLDFVVRPGEGISGKAARKR